MTVSGEEVARGLITSLRGSCSAPTTHTPTDRPWEVKVEGDGQGQDTTIARQVKPTQLDRGKRG